MLGNKKKHKHKPALLILYFKYVLHMQGKLLSNKKLVQLFVLVKKSIFNQMGFFNIVFNAFSICSSHVMPGDFKATSKRLQLNKTEKHGCPLKRFLLKIMLTVRLYRVNKTRAILFLVSEALFYQDLLEQAKFTPIISCAS